MEYSDTDILAIRSSTLVKVDFKKIVDDGLNITRKNLLDLSARNRLLNFKHSGTKILRFVDEVPNQIYSDLVEGSTTEIQKGFQIYTFNLFLITIINLQEE